MLTACLIWLQILLTGQERLWQHICCCKSLWKKGLLTVMPEDSYCSSSCTIVLWVHLKDLQNTWDSYIRLRSSIHISIHEWTLQACESKAEAFNSISLTDWWEHWGTESVHWSMASPLCESLSEQLIRPSTGDELCLSNPHSWVYRHVTLWAEIETDLTFTLSLKGLYTVFWHWRLQRIFVSTTSTTSWSSVFRILSRLTCKATVTI